jgi:predicted transcriptional regulator
LIPNSNAYAVLRDKSQEFLDFVVLSCTGQKCSYTTGMKTAVSIPEDVFKGAERLARKTKRSRSRLFSDALKEYLARHTPDSVTEAMNQACFELGAAKDEFVSSAARRVLERSEW